MSTFPPPNPPQTIVIQSPASQSNGLGIAGFVISLVGFLSGCFGGVVLCPVGLILSAVALRKEPRGLAIAGTVLGGLGSIWLVVVLIIFGGLTAVGIAGVKGAIQDAESMALVGTNTQSFYTAEGRLPKDLDELVAKYPDSPIKDHKGNAISYQIDTPTSFTLSTPGFDGQAGTDDDIKSSITVQ